MENLINGFTSREIKKSLKVCAAGGDYDDCKNRCPFHRNCGDGMIAAAEYIEQLEFALKCEQVARDVLMEDMPKWISVENKLPPPETERYLVVVNFPDGSRVVKTAVWAWDENDEKGDWVNWEVVTHWMPLPSTEVSK